jgi:hypothetical protein
MLLHQVKLVFRAQALLTQVFGSGLFGCLVQLAVGFFVKGGIRSSALPGILEDKSAGLAEIILDLEAK